MVQSDDLSTAFAALAHPTRRAILARLAKGEASVNQLAEPFDLSLPAISKHIGVLEKAGLITRGRQAQFRPCRINPEAIKSVADWADAYRPIWNQRFDAMAAVLEDMKEDDK
ncbi:MAG: metalloregulator ArsR/SmtB family transcription factor [Pseudomonadota bacterium]